MVNEIAVVLLYGLFGWKVAAIYLGMGPVVAILSGWVIGRMRMENHLEDWVFQIQPGGGSIAEPRKNWAERIRYGFEAVRDIVGRVWIYVVLGIVVGAGIHGYVPEGIMAGFIA